MPDTDPNAATKPTDDVDKEQLGEAGLSALRAERANVKDLKAQLKEVQDALKAREEADMSELQKAQKKATDFEAKLKAYEHKAKLEEIKAKVAETAGVPADLLAGDDEASITAHAERIKAHLGPQTPEPNPFKGQVNDGSPNTDTVALQALGFGPS